MRETRSSGSVEGVMGNHDPYSDSSALWAADDPMVGDWKLNPLKSKLIDEMKVTSLGGNKYSFDFGGGLPEMIVVDGTDQPANFGTTFAVTAVSPDEWRGVRKKDGRVEIQGIWKLSKDGNTLMTITPAPATTGRRSISFTYTNAEEEDRGLRVTG
jgi:hypothetical protein